MTVRLICLSSAMALLVGTLAYGQGSPFPPVGGRAAAPSPFPPVSGSSPPASQSAPSPFPSVSGAPPPAASPFPSVSGASSSPAAAPVVAPALGMPTGGGFGRAAQPQQPPCMEDFMKLRTDLEKRAAAVKAVGQRRAGPDEACKALTGYADSNLKMLKFVETNSATCGIPGEVLKNVKTGNAGAQQMRQRVCTAASQPRGPAGPSFSDILGSSALPEASATPRGGSTFETLNGNVLTR